MSDTAVTTEPAATDEVTPGDLFDNLRELGRALPVSFQPNAHDAGALLSGVIYYLATGSLVAPRIEVPNQAQINADLHEQTELNAERARVAELERQLAAATAGPAAVAPAPLAPVEPEPTAPLESPAETRGTDLAETRDPDAPSPTGMFSDQAKEAKAAELREQLAALEAGGNS